MHNAPDLLPILYHTEQIHGWGVGMRAITHALLAQWSASTGPILELGCGAGGLMAELAAHYPAQPIFGADINPLALAYANHLLAQPPKLVDADLQALPFTDAIFSLVLALDTIDQKGVDPMLALRESWRVLQSQGLLLLRVSAHPWLESAHDAAFNTGRRFTAVELGKILHGVGFHTVRMTYANTLLAPAIIALRLSQRWGILPFQEDHYMMPLVNHLLATLLQVEARWLQRHNFGFGVSLYVLAQKSEPGPLFHQEQCHANQCTRLHCVADL